MSLSQIHEIDIGKDYCYNQAYYRPNHATHHLLDDKHAYDDDDKTCYVISEVTHIKKLGPSPALWAPSPQGAREKLHFYR
jgi:hypothetical protein